MRVNGPLAWSAKAFKTTVPTSTAEAETAQASRATKDLIFAKGLAKGTKRAAMGPSALLVDNSALTDHVEKEGPSHRTRHFERATMIVKWAVLKMLISLKLIGTDYMIADIFTKAVDKDTFLRLRNNMINASNDQYARLSFVKASRYIQAASEFLSRWGPI